jgi:hypothetical protein
MAAVQRAPSAASKALPPASSISTAVCETSLLPEAATPRFLANIYPHTNSASEDNTSNSSCKVAKVRAEIYPQRTQMTLKKAGLHTSHEDFVQQLLLISIRGLRRYKFCVFCVLCG